MQALRIGDQPTVSLIKRKDADGFFGFSALEKPRNQKKLNMKIKQGPSFLSFFPIFLFQKDGKKKKDLPMNLLLNRVLMVV